MEKYIGYQTSGLDWDETATLLFHWLTFTSAVIGSQDVALWTPAGVAAQGVDTLSIAHAWINRPLALILVCGDDRTLEG